jgi:type II secretory pathway pseudopilin PulG
MKKLAAMGTARAFTLIELIVIVLTLIVLAGTLVTGLIRARRTARLIQCNSNLKQIGLSFRTWAIDHSNERPPRVPMASGGSEELVGTGQVFVHLRLMSNELVTPKILVCPADKAKTAVGDFGLNFSDTNVSYFVSVDADENTPQMFGAGDRNLAFQGQPLKPGLFALTTNSPSLSWTKAIYNCPGNIGLADGSVQGFGAERLAEAAKYQGVATNLLAIP